jgi:glycine reductase
MRLEIGDFQVNDVLLGSKTDFADGVLTVNEQELRAKLLEDNCFRDVEIAVARPGSSTRIHNIVDVVEPRIRVSDVGSDFPGILAAPRTVGEGLTHRLAGVSVVEVSEAVPGEQTHWRTAIVDLDGIAKDFSPFGSLINIVLTFFPDMTQFPTFVTDDLNILEGTPQAMKYALAVRRAGLKAAVYLAESVRTKQPDRVRVFDIGNDDPAPDLPRVVYLCQAVGLYAYGEPTNSPGEAGAGPLPTIIHPNEILDGAFVNLQSWPACHRDVTYLHQNHAVVEELYRRHGSELNFCGVIIYTRGGSAKSKERMSSYCAKLAKFLGANAAVLTYVGSGHALVDVMMTCQRLERENIRTTLLLPEMAGGADQSGLIYVVPEADAMVSTGNYESSVDFPAMKQVLGGERISETGDSAVGPFTMPLRTVLASTDPSGAWTLQGHQY